MTSAPGPAPPLPKATRQVEVKVVDFEGGPVPGARVEFFVGEALLGTVVAGAKGARIRLPESLGTLDVRVQYDGEEQRIRLPVSLNRHTFQFHVPIDFARPLAAPVARCPDGTTGQPCVDCVIADQIIRICA